MGQRLIEISRRLAAEVDRLSFAPPVAYVYNPLVYARRSHEAYLERFGKGPKEVVLIGMNPGPFGMAQTGVPFGDCACVRDFLGIEAKVDKPKREHPKRPVLGFDCHRAEVSGTRLWSWAKERFGTPDRFFERFFVINYCPLVFMEESGRNRVPEKLPAAEREPLFAACDRALEESIEALAPAHVVGVGKFAEKRARAVVGDRYDVGSVLHPSPASPKANSGWAAKAEEELRALGIELPSDPAA